MCGLLAVLLGLGYGACALAKTRLVVYSTLVGNWVFIVTNSCLLLTALVGQWISWRRRGRG